MAYGLDADTKNYAGGSRGFREAMGGYMGDTTSFGQTIPGSVTSPYGPDDSSGNTGTINYTGTTPSGGPQAGTTPIGSASPTGGGSSQMPAGIDPALAAIYQKAGMTPGDRGTGFADWQYWQGVGPSQYDRLARDLAGTGTDQPTGTPGSGPWQSSGGGDRASGGGGGSLGGYSAGGQFGFGGYQPSSIMTDPRSSSFYNTLMSRAGKSLNVDPNDPIIKGDVDAYRAEQERGARSAETQAAEKAGVNANLEPQQRAAEERVGQQTAGFQAQIMDNERAARRQEIAQALQLGAGFLTDQQRMQLQEEEDQLRSAQEAFEFQKTQGLGESQFARSLAERGFEFGAANNP